MKTWELDLSNSYAYVEKFVTIKSENEPTRSECEAIAKKYGYTICGVTEIWWERS